MSTRLELIKSGKKIQIDFPKLHLFNFRTLNNLNPTFRHWHNSRYFRIPLTYYKDPTAHCTSKVYIKYSRVQNLETQNFLCVRMKLKLISFELCYCSRRSRFWIFNSKVYDPFEDSGVRTPQVHKVEIKSEEKFPLKIKVDGFWHFLMKQTWWIDSNIIRNTKFSISNTFA